MAVYKRGKIWWYKFSFNGEMIRESTKQTNKRVAERLEASRKAALVEGRAGIGGRKAVPTLREFAERDFLPYVRSTFASKPKTLRYYENGAKRLLAYGKLADEPLDRITTETIAGYVAKRQEAGLRVSSINRELQVLRRMFHLASEWGKTNKSLCRVRMLPGEGHRERVLTPEEEARYLRAAREWCTLRRPLLPDVAVILLDCGLRPEECFRLRWENIRDGAIEILSGKTMSARRRIPMSQRAAAALEMRKAESGASEWVFPADTQSGHIEPCSVKRAHAAACKAAGIERFPLYTLRHTCLTRWAPNMDPWTLAYLAGHRDMAITRRYVHPQADTIREALERARTAETGHRIGHSAETGEEAESGEGALIN